LRVAGLGPCAEHAELGRLCLPLHLRLHAFLRLLAHEVSVHAVGAVQRVAPANVAVAALEALVVEVVVVGLLVEACRAEGRRSKVKGQRRWGIGDVGE